MSGPSCNPIRGQYSGHVTTLDQSEASIPSTRRGTLAKLASIDEILEYEQEMAIMEKLNLNSFDK